MNFLDNLRRSTGVLLHPVVRALCKMRHKRHHHEQVYTDRARYYQRTECWKCGTVQSGYSVCRDQKHPPGERPNAEVSDVRGAHSLH